MIIGTTRKKRSGKDPAGLAPCPYCGSTSIEYQGQSHMVWMMCLNCKATGPEVFANPESAWNARVDGEQRRRLFLTVPYMSISALYVFCIVYYTKGTVRRGFGYDG